MGSSIQWFGIPAITFTVPPHSVQVSIGSRRQGTPLSITALRLASRNARDLTPVEGAGLPDELTPVTTALNQLLRRLDAAVEAERNFAAIAAHELRTPVAGAIAQAQRIQAETTDAQAASRAAQIVPTLKRLTRMAKKL